MEPQVKGYLALTALVVVIGLVVVAIASGKFGSKAKKLTDGATKVVEKVSETTKKVTG